MSAIWRHCVKLYPPGTKVQKCVFCSTLVDLSQPQPESKHFRWCNQFSLKICFWNFVFVAPPMGFHRNASIEPFPTSALKYLSVLVIGLMVIWQFILKIILQKYLWLIAATFCWLILLIYDRDVYFCHTMLYSKCSCWLSKVNLTFWVQRGGNWTLNPSWACFG